MGPASSGTPPEDGQPAFDALLYPAPAAPVSATDDKERLNPTGPLAQPTKELHEPAATSAPATVRELTVGELTVGELFDPPDHTTESRPDEATHPARLASEPPKKQAGELTANSKQTSTAEEVIVASLAGLPAVNPITPASTKPSNESAGEISGEQPIEPSAAIANRTALPQLAAALAVNGSGPVQTQQEQPPEHEHPAKIEINTKATAKVAEGQHAKTIIADASNSIISEAANEQTSKGTQVEAALLDELQASESPVHEAERLHDQPYDTNQHSLTETIDAELQSLAAPSGSSSSSPPAVTAPTASPQSALLDPPQSRSPEDSANSTVTVALPQRSRLPVELFTPDVSNIRRRPAVDVDAARLLMRVARAFTAAQERDGEVRLRLSPPELGSLRLEVRVQDGALVAHLQTETNAARTAILDNLPELRERLADQRVRIERFDVDLMQRQGGGMPDQPGSRQQEPPMAVVRPVPAPRAAPIALQSSPRPYPTVGGSDGLNVIV